MKKPSQNLILLAFATVFSPVLGLGVAGCSESPLATDANYVDQVSDETSSSVTPPADNPDYQYPAGATIVSTTEPEIVSPPTLNQDGASNAQGANVRSDNSSVSLSSTTSSVPIVSAMPAPTAEDLAAAEQASLMLLNALRSEHGFGELVRDPEMDEFARTWSETMATSGDFVHSSGPYGENIAFTSDIDLSPQQAADLFHQLWVDSPDHLSNMVNGDYTTVGLGVFKNENGWYVTHAFRY